MLELMINTNLLYKFGLLFLIFILFVGIYFFIKNPYWLAIDSCMDAGNVWDDERKECRSDCLKWDKRFGCIELTSEQTELLKKCKRNINCLSEEVYREICLHNKKAWNIETQNCDFEFQFEDCGKDKSKWLYPDACF